MVWLAIALGLVWISVDKTIWIAQFWGYLSSVGDTGLISINELVDMSVYFLWLLAGICALCSLYGYHNSRMQRSAGISYRK